MSDTNSNKQLWGGRFSEAPDQDMQVFGASLPVDKRLWAQDIAGSKAHASMLANCGIIEHEDAAKITAGLDAIAAQIKSGEFEFNIADEDIHMSIERELTKLIGESGGRLHTARSRNDQVATDTRLYIKQQTLALCEQINALRQTLIDVAEAQQDVIMPGYTHLQKAQPLLFSHHMLAYFWMLSRDFTRMKAASSAADMSPLGAAALAGTGHPIDRDATAKELGFSGVIANSLDAVSDRDFLLDTLYACSACMIHLSRLSEEIVLWSSEEFGFITLSDACSTGSSIMPQKKNPDYAELVRGKSGRVVGDLMGLFMVLKALPLAYNKDLQEDKEGAFDAIDTLYASLGAIRMMLSTMQVNRDIMYTAAHGGYMAATDLADLLVEWQLPFREAHEVSGKLVLVAEQQGKTLNELTAAELMAASPLFDNEQKCRVALEALKIKSVIAKRTSAGGTAAVQVSKQLELARQSLQGL